MTFQLWDPPIAVAHRGSRLLWPENTMEAFSQAVGMGYRHIETDLRVTSDGVLVCMHDSTLDRTTDGSGPVSAFSFPELARLDAGYRHSVGGRPEFRGRGIRVPRFDDVVAAFPGVSFFVDLKAGPEALAELTERHSLPDRVIVGSFSHADLTAFREATRGRVPTSTSPKESRLWLMASRLGLGVSTGARALQLPTRVRGVRIVDRRLVRTAHDHGIQVHVWTVNDPAEMRLLLDLGVDGIVTDRPDLLKEVLETRGDWHSP